MVASFTKRILRINLTLAQGTFDTGKNSLTLQGFRAEAIVKKSGADSKNHCTLKIYGMSQAHMDSLTTLPSQSKQELAAFNNLVQVLAGDSISGQFSLVFEGNIVTASASYQSPPNLVFKIDAVEGYYSARAPASPISIFGTVPAVQAFQQIAATMGKPLENSGVTRTVSNVYLQGTSYEQLQTLGAATDTKVGVDNGVVFIVPKGDGRSGTVPLVSPQTGLKEFPILDKEGIKFETLYNPLIKFNSAVQVQSSVKNVSGVWIVHDLETHLESENPSGKWISKCSAALPGN